jgi:hypothetical protein
LAQAARARARPKRPDPIARRVRGDIRVSTAIFAPGTETITDGSARASLPRPISSSTSTPKKRRAASSDGCGPIARPSLLCIDEIGYLSYDAHAADLLFQLVSRRYEQKSIVLTTNVAFKDCNTIFPNASCAVALIDRLTHHAEILTIQASRTASAKPNSRRKPAALWHSTGDCVGPEFRVFS